MSNEGFNDKPQEVREAIRKGDAETLRRLGKKGAEVRARNVEKRKIVQEHDAQEAFDELYESQLESLRKTYPQLDAEGEPIEEGWYEAEAERIARAILAMRERQRSMEEALQAKER